MRSRNHFGKQSSGTPVVLAVLAVPQSKDNGIAEIMQDGTVKIHITAPPVEGKANQAVIKLLSEFFDLPKTQIRIIRGVKSRRKLIAMEGLDRGEVEARLERRGETW